MAKCVSFTGLLPKLSNTGLNLGNLRFYPDLVIGSYWVILVILAIMAHRTFD